MKLWPSSLGGWVLIVLGFLLMLIGVWTQARMWQVELGLRPVAAGGGEYIMALFFGVPVLLGAVLVNCFSTFQKNLRCKVGVICFAGSLLPVLIMVLMFVRDLWF
jgi:predicted phage tail protein